MAGAFNYQLKRTVEQAIKEVDSYVEPRDCFITYIDNKWGYQSFSTTKDTPCAHYVSHQLGLKGRGAVCHKGFLLRVSDLVGLLGDPIEPETVVAGDVWARLKGAHMTKGGKEPTSHCGMVESVSSDKTGLHIVIKHCSSGQRKVASNDWKQYFHSGGAFYRLPDRLKTAQAHANLQRFVKGFAFTDPFA